MALILYMFAVIYWTVAGVVFKEWRARRKGH
jgi:hypothetical protein